MKTEQSSVSPKLCGPHGHNHCHAARCCCQWVYAGVNSWCPYTVSEASNSNGWHRLAVLWSEIQQQGSLSVQEHTDTYDLIFFRLGEVGCAHCTPAAFLWVQNGETTPHNLPQYAEELHHQYDKDPIFQQHWNVFASRCETQQEYTWWYPWLHTTACTVTISSTDKEQMVWCLCPCIVFLTCTLFSRSVTVRACLGLGKVHQLLPAHNICDQSTLVVFNIHVAPHTTHFHLHISVGWHPSAQKMPALWSCQNTITT